jgi:rhodanese-related sulfurtransferase
LDGLVTSKTHALYFLEYSELVFERITPLEAMSRLESGAVLIDVREQDEWDAVHVPNAMLIPLSEFQVRYTEMPKEKEIVLICAGGVRSAQAAQFAAGHGFKVVNLEGGIKAWIAEGLAVEE